MTTEERLTLVPDSAPERLGQIRRWGRFLYDIVMPFSNPAAIPGQGLPLDEWRDNKQINDLAPEFNSRVH